MRNTPIHLKKIFIYPIKSLPGICISQSLVKSSLKFDRQWALKFMDGRYLNGKNDVNIHHINADYRFDEMTVTLSYKGHNQQRFSLQAHENISQWISDLWGRQIDFVRSDTHFADDQKANGPTLISTASLLQVGEWFGINDLDQLRRRFRANLEISGCPAFWEDRLPFENGGIFKLGETIFTATNICKRCIVPTRDPATGEATAHFISKFMELRRQNFNPAAPEIDNYYRLAINTRITQADKTVIKTGDTLSL